MRFKLVFKYLIYLNILKMSCLRNYSKVSQLAKNLQKYLHLNVNTSKSWHAVVVFAPIDWLPYVGSLMTENVIPSTE